MLKSDLIAKLAAQQTHIPVDHVLISVNEILRQMCDALSNGEPIEIRGFGSFSLHYRPSRHARNPKTGKVAMTLPKYRPHFKPAKKLRARVTLKSAAT